MVREVLMELRAFRYSLIKTKHWAELAGILRKIEQSFGFNFPEEIFCLLHRPYLVFSFFKYSPSSVQSTMSVYNANLPTLFRKAQGKIYLRLPHEWTNSKPAYPSRLKKPHYFFVGHFVLKKRTTSPPQIQIAGVRYSIVPRFWTYINTEANASSGKAHLQLPSSTEKTAKNGAAPPSLSDGAEPGGRGNPGPARSPPAGRMRVAPGRRAEQRGARGWLPTRCSSDAPC